MGDFDLRPVTLILSADAAQDLFDALTVARHRRERGVTTEQPNHVTQLAPHRRARCRAVSAGEEPA